MVDCAFEEAAILKLTARLAQASDDRDSVAYRACFADSICGNETDGTAIVGADDYVRDAMARLERTVWTHHRLINPVIEVEPGGARAIASIDVVVEVCRADEHGAWFRGTLGGRYRLGFVRANGGWRIDRRTLFRRYAYCVPAGLPG